MLGLSIVTISWLGHKTLAKINKCILWESIGYMEFIMKNNVYLLFFDCMLHTLYNNKIYSKLMCVHIYVYVYKHTHTIVFSLDIVQPPDYIRSRALSLPWEWVIGVKVVKTFKVKRPEEALNLPRMREWLGVGPPGPRNFMMEWQEAWQRTAVMKGSGC